VIEGSRRHCHKANGPEDHLGHREVPPTLVANAMYRNWISTNLALAEEAVAAQVKQTVRGLRVEALLCSRPGYKWFCKFF
jgi:hypothetical protein